MREQLAEQVAALHQGEHLCLIYDDPAEQLAAIVAFVKAGLEHGERCVYIADDRTTREVLDALAAGGVDVSGETTRGAFALLTEQDTYLRSGTFEPQAMIAFLRDATDQAIAAGFRGLRATGEMTWTLGVEPGCERLVEYEALLNDFFPGSRALGLCQYNRKRFPATTIRGALRTHPMVVVRDWVCCDNIYYEPPDLMLGGSPEAPSVESMLARLERRRAGEALRQASADNRGLIEASLDPLVTIDAAGKITNVNEATETVTGRARGELIGTDFSDYFTEPEKAREAYRQVFQLGAGRDYALEIRHRDGHVTPVRYNASLHRDEAGNVVGVFAAARDVTERKRAEKAVRNSKKELQRLNEELEQRVLARTAELEAANKELEAFSYSVSHDLRAPLRALSGFSRILLEEYAKTLTAEPKHYLEMIHGNAQRMGRLMDDLLAFSRLGRQPLKKERILPAELARQAVADLGSEAAGRQVKITIGELCPCEADPVLLRQVFLNLLSNALKFTRRRDVAVIEVGCRRDDERVYFVKDNGIGFDMRYADKLFGVFQRLHSAEEYEGTGVGLAIVQRIIHRHGGWVWAEGQVSEGASFFFTLPESDRHD
jgi:PAS domain S-box-containing protein